MGQRASFPQALPKSLWHPWHCWPETVEVWRVSVREVGSATHGQGGVVLFGLVWFGRHLARGPMRRSTR